MVRDGFEVRNFGGAGAGRDKGLLSEVQKRWT